MVKLVRGNGRGNIAAANCGGRRTACRTLASAQSLSEGVKHATPVSLDVTDDQALDAEVAKHDLVISLIPYTFHATVIKSAIRQKKHVVTTSYVSPAMMELDQQCKDAGITVMNEIGLDPGTSTPQHKAPGGRDAVLRASTG